MAGRWRESGGEVAGEVAEMSQELPPRWFCFSFHFSGPGRNRALPSRNCQVVHDPLKIAQKDTPITSLRWIFGPPPQVPPPLRSRKTTLPSLPAGFPNLLGKNAECIEIRRAYIYNAGHIEKFESEIK